MPPPELHFADIVRLKHMRDAAREALNFSAGRDRTMLDTDAMFRRAVVSCIQEIGEAAVRISLEARALLPDVPWRQIVDMRNRLVHVYFNVDPDLVWEVVARDLAPLLDSLDRALL